MNSNINSGFDAQFSFIICGASIDVERISEAIGIDPTKVLRRGQLLNRLPQIIAQDDAWYHTITLSNPGGRDPALNGLLDTLCAARPFLDTLIEEGYTITLRLSVHSDSACMAYSLMPETLSTITKIGLPLDVNSISWGDFSF